MLVGITENVTFAADGRPIYDYIQVGTNDDCDAVFRNFRKSDLVYLPMLVKMASRPLSLLLFKKNMTLV